MNSESSRLIHQCTETVQSIKSSSAYYVEEQKIKLENLRATYNSLTYKIAQQEREHSNLRHEQGDLVTKNRMLYRFVQELRSIRYCHA